MEFEKLTKAFTKANNILLISHKGPDGDAIGSHLAVAEYLGSLGKQYTSYCATPVSSMFSFAPGYEQFISDENLLRQQQFDMIVVFDSGDLEYAGVAEYITSIAYPYTLVNMDHHKTNAQFGHMNFVNEHASSTCEIAYFFLMSAGARLNRNMATNLLLGITTDTGQFSNLGTNHASIDIAAHLMNLGANYKAIHNFMRERSVTTLKFWGRILSRLQKNETLGFVSAVIMLKDFEELGVTEDDCKEIINFLNTLDNAKAVLIVREKQDGTLKGSLRTTTQHVDVSRIAGLLGVGGGHKKAAGFSMLGKIQETECGWVVV